MIWFDKEITIEKIRNREHETMAEYIGIEFIEIGKDYLKARMPVDHRTKQPYGLLHGGANCVLAETAGSFASSLVVDHVRYAVVGLDINANHIRSATQGYVTGVATPLHLGANTHVWDIKIYDELNKLICISRLTIAVVPKKESFIRPGL